MTRTVLLAVAALLFSSCGVLEPDHHLRVRNEYATALNIDVGSIPYGVVASGATTAYQAIDEGDYSITGDVTGSISIAGKGSHKWTLAITSLGAVSAKED